MHGIGGRANLAPLVCLRLAHEVPAHARERCVVGELGALRGEFLLAVLGDIAHAERREIVNERRRMKFRDHDTGDVLGLTPGTPCRIGHALVDGGEPLRKGGPAT